MHDGVRDIASVYQTLVRQSAAATLPVYQDSPAGPPTLGENEPIVAVRPVLCPRGDVLGPGAEGVFIVDAGTTSLKGVSPAVAIPFRIEEAPCLGDLDTSGSVNGGDLAAVLYDWGLDGSPADLDGNDVVNGGDLAIVLNAWGPCPD